MLFNSFSFLLLFLPLAMLGYWVTERLGGRTASIAWLSIISLIFYGLSEPWHLLVIMPSIIVNFTIGVSLASKECDRRLLVSGIAINLGVLGYFKYANFFMENIQALTGLPLPAVDITLPAGVSFFTFTQIAFLVDAYSHKTKEVNFSRYVLFVTFFPHLIAGPIIHHSEMLPQFAKGSRGMNARNISIGLSILIIGLAKKVLIADNLALVASPIFDAADQGQFITTFEAWSGALAYTFQLYFDFSGYSDMAIGLSLLFGIRMPVNFNSPYKSRSIVQFWRRWHMTLSRFLLTYLYIPLGGSRQGIARMFLALMATMLLGGLWHGAGWTFVAWGALHGGYLIINHGWMKLSKSDFSVVRPLNTLVGIVAWPLTFVAVCAAWVIFRAETMDGALTILSSMSTLDGLTFPGPAEQRLGAAASVLRSLGVEFIGTNVVSLEDWRTFGLPIIILAAAISLLAPNTQQIFARYRPALSVYKGDLSDAKKQRTLSWRPVPIWSLYITVLGVVCLLSLNKISEFIYFRF